MSSRRKSRRLLDLEPKSYDDLPPVQCKELNNLLSKGGIGGKSNSKHSDWNYFPNQSKRTPSIISVSDLRTDIAQIKRYTEHQDEEESFDSTYLLLHVNQIKQLANYNCETCKGQCEKSVSNINFKHSTHGMASSINLTCCQCHQETTIPPRLSRFAGTRYDGQPSARPNNSWYEPNIRLVLATLAIGNGASDLSDFSAFLDLPQASSFATRPFNKIECMIGEDLRCVSEDSMIEALNREIKLTLEAAGKNYNEWKESKQAIKLTVSFDMG